MKKQAFLELLANMPVKSMSVTKITVKKIPKSGSTTEDTTEVKPDKKNMEEVAVCPMSGDKKVASDNKLMDAYFEGFVKECEARGVDSEKLVAILLSQGD